jgi:hypothetical protein
MNEKHDINDVFLSKKLCIERSLLLLQYSIETISRANLDDITPDHLKALENVSHQLIIIRETIDQLLKNDAEIFNIEPSIKD